MAKSRVKALAQSDLRRNLTPNSGLALISASAFSAVMSDLRRNLTPNSGFWPRSQNPFTRGQSDLRRNLTPNSGFGPPWQVAGTVQVRFASKLDAELRISCGWAGGASMAPSDLR